MTRHYPDLGSVSDWLKQISRAARPIRNSTQIWPVTRHQHGISALVFQTSFRGKTSGRVEKCLLFSLDRLWLAFHKPLVSCNNFFFPFVVWSLHLSFANFLEVERLVLWLSTDVKRKCEELILSLSCSLPCWVNLKSVCCFLGLIMVNSWNDRLISMGER